MAKWSQEDRSIGIVTPLGEDVLILQGMSGEEAISELFTFQLDLASDEVIKPKDIIGKNVSIWLRLQNGTERFFNAHVSRFTAGAMQAEGYRSYYAQLVPWLWFLSRNRDCRIFQSKTVLEILEEVFGFCGVANFHIDCSGNHPTLDYCVQYQESDLEFVHRLMQENGIFYFFTHEEGKHTLNLIDDDAQYLLCEEHEVFHAEGDIAEDHISSWDHEFEFFTGKWAQKDFDFKSPGNDLTTNSTTVLDFPDAKKYEKFDYPGGYGARDDGTNLTDIHMVQEELGYELISASSSYRTFASGATFTIKKHVYSEGEEKTYVITRIKHEAFEDTYTTNASGRQIYENSFTAIPATIPYQCDLGYKKPKIYGPQTAIVVGPEGEEIHTDEFGRVRVSFHWDRYNEANENASCWIRVSQAWAGRFWGAVSIPRIGQEVIVSFLDGDPDRPIITGRVYNGANMPPYDLPAYATMTTMKTNSSVGGGGFNEIRLQDEKDAEQIFMHAQMNFDIRVKNDRYETVGNDRGLVVENDKKEHVKNERHETVDGNHYEKISGIRNLKVVGEEAKEVGEQLSLSVGGDMAEEIGGGHSQTISGDSYIKASNIVIEGDSNVTVKVGQSFIAIESGGITIGTTGDIELDATGSVTVSGTSGITIESPATAEVTSTSTTVSGDAMLTLEGGLVKIN